MESYLVDKGSPSNEWVKAILGSCECESSCY